MIKCKVLIVDVVFVYFSVRVMVVTESCTYLNPKQ